MLKKIAVEHANLKDDEGERDQIEADFGFPNLHVARVLGIEVETIL